MSDIKMYDGHGRCYSADQIAQIARFIEGGRPEGLRLYPINGAPGRFLVDAEQFDAQRLRADTAESELKALKHPMNSAQQLRKDLAAAEQRIAELTELLGELDENWNSHDGRERFSLAMRKVEAALSTASPATINQQGEEA